MSAHNLGAVPDLIIVKDLTSGSASWAVYISVLANTQRGKLDTTDAFGTEINTWDSTTPDASVFRVGSSGEVNTNGNEYIAYIWTRIEGFSEFFLYNGNSSTDGPFTYLGFDPSYAMIKESGANGEDWLMWTRAINPGNPFEDFLNANNSNAEGNTNPTRILDGLSNGLKQRSSGIQTNGSGRTYIGLAIAGNPFGGTGISPNTAR